MNVQARKISGSQNSNTDTLEVQLAYDLSEVYGAISHSVELVSGVSVTHGGGAISGEYLHYKSAEDVNSEGVVDYSSVNMEIVQVERGDSVIKVLVSYLLQSEIDSHTVAYEAWVNEPESDNKEKHGPNYPVPTVIETGEITLSYQEDVFV